MKRVDPFELDLESLVLVLSLSFVSALLLIPFPMGLESVEGVHPSGVSTETVAQSSVEAASASLAGGSGPLVSSAPSNPGNTTTQLVYDARDHFVLLFGDAGPQLNQTWKYSNGSWTELHPKVSPPGRYDEALIYDAKDHYVLLFGGDGPRGWFNDSWIFSKGSWTKLSSPKAPPPRSGAGVAYDTRDGYVLLFGGYVPTTCGYCNDTWIFSGGSWTQAHPANVPVGREYPAVAFDPQAHGVIMYGGDGYSSPLGRNDTWFYAGGNWSVLKPRNNPGERTYVSMVYDPMDKALVEFGGYGPGHFRIQNSTWEYRNRNWIQVYPTSIPPARAYAAMTFDSFDGYVLLYGGFGRATQASLNDTWSYSLGNWTQR